MVTSLHVLIYLHLLLSLYVEVLPLICDPSGAPSTCTLCTGRGHCLASPVYTSVPLPPNSVSVSFRILFSCSSFHSPAGAADVSGTLTLWRFDDPPDVQPYWVHTVDVIESHLTVGVTCRRRNVVPSGYRISLLSNLVEWYKTLFICITSHSLTLFSSNSLPRSPLPERGVKKLGVSRPQNLCSSLGLFLSQKCCCVGHPDAF